MKEPRVEQIVEELKATVERLNRLNSILVKTETSFDLRREVRDGDFILSDIQQRVEY